MDGINFLLLIGILGGLYCILFATVFVIRYLFMSPRELFNKTCAFCGQSMPGGTEVWCPHCKHKLSKE